MRIIYGAEMLFQDLLFLSERHRRKRSSAFKTDRTEPDLHSLTHEGTEAHAFQNGKHEFYIYINYMYSEEFLYLSLLTVFSTVIFSLGIKCRSIGAMNKGS